MTTVFSLEESSSSEPDDLIGDFFQAYWNIAHNDIFSIVQAFLKGDTLLKSITHINLILIPKNLIIQIADLRSIILSNFINNVIFQGYSWKDT